MHGELVLELIKVGFQKADGKFQLGGQKGDVSIETGSDDAGNWFARPTVTIGNEKRKMLDLPPTQKKIHQKHSQPASGFDVDHNLPEGVQGEVRIKRCSSVQSDRLSAFLVDEDVGAASDEGHRRTRQHLKPDGVVTVHHAAEDLDLRRTRPPFGTGIFEPEHSAGTTFVILSNAFRLTLAVAVYVS